MWAGVLQEHGAKGERLDSLRFLANVFEARKKGQSAGCGHTKIWLPSFVQRLPNGGW